MLFRSRRPDRALRSETATQKFAADVDIRRIDAEQPRDAALRKGQCLARRIDDEPVAMSPDLICVLDGVTGEAIGTETIRYGQRVTVIVLPPPPVFLSPKGLTHVGPRAFGYDLDFRSVFQA